jgi:ACT domain-containing protein
MENTEKKYWMFYITTSDCAGALTSISAAFSNEGVNILTVIGHGACPDKKGAIEIGFESDDQTKDILVRKIKRLSKAISIKEEETSSEELAKIISR